MSAHHAAIAANVPPVFDAAPVFDGVQSYIVKKGQTGVYGIRHLPSGQVYVGASGYCIYNRLRHHFVKLRQGKHATPKLQALWNEGHPQQFEQLLLELCPGDQVKIVEQKFIRVFQDRLFNGSADAARKRWANPEYRAAITESAREVTTRRWADGSFTGTTGMKLPSRSVL